jgi:uncharacterized protein (DUF1697 family)
VTTRVAFLRAVNLGNRRTPNARLVEIAADLGHGGAWTHVNSGNLVFDATGGRAELEKAFEKALEAEFGFAVETFVRSAAELRKALALEPFDVGTGDTYFVTFLKDTPTRAQKKELEDLSGSFDTLVVAGRDVHWLMHGKSTDTKIPTRAWEKVIGHHTSTSRNTTMLRKLVDKISALH